MRFLCSFVLVFFLPLMPFPLFVFLLGVAHSVISLQRDFVSFFSLFNLNTTPSSLLCHKYKMVRVSQLYVVPCVCVHVCVGFTLLCMVDVQVLKPCSSELHALRIPSRDTIAMNAFTGRPRPFILPRAIVIHISPHHTHTQWSRCWRNSQDQILQILVKSTHSF